VVVRATPLGITPDALVREHDSIQRNPLIAEAFYRAGLIMRRRCLFSEDENLLRPNAAVLRLSPDGSS
jgi:hypothetical protein